MSPADADGVAAPGEADALDASLEDGVAVDVSSGEGAGRHAADSETDIARRAGKPHVHLSRCMIPDYTKPAAPRWPGWTPPDFMRESE